MLKSAINIGLGLAIGSFIYQVFTQQDWALAAERSFFQFVALGIFVYLNKGRYIEVSDVKEKVILNKN